MKAIGAVLCVAVAFALVVSTVQVYSGTFDSSVVPVKPEGMRKYTPTPELKRIDPVYDGDGLEMVPIYQSIYVDEGGEIVHKTGIWY